MSLPAGAPWFLQYLRDQIREIRKTFFFFSPLSYQKQSHRNQENDLLNFTFKKKFFFSIDYQYDDNLKKKVFLIIELNKNYLNFTYLN